MSRYGNKWEKIIREFYNGTCSSLELGIMKLILLFLKQRLPIVYIVDYYEPEK